MMVTEIQNHEDKQNKIWRRQQREKDKQEGNRRDSEHQTKKRRINIFD